MKMFYGKTPIQSLNIRHYEMDTNSATMVPSDLQAGVTAFAKGKKITGTGKCFSFAIYGRSKTNESNIVPTIINIIQIGSVDYPIRMTLPMNDMVSHDFTTAQSVAEVTIDGEVYPIIVSVQNGELSIVCEQTISIQLFIGRDEYA